MLKDGFESRVKIQQIIENQLPEFILDESPKAAEFLKQYYISQEYQSAPIDLIENLDQYLKLDKLTPEVIVGSTSLQNSISKDDTTIEVSSTKGFPKKYGLLKIDDEIITYTNSTSNSFTGCIRGFSGITDYHKDLQYEELVFSTSSAANHNKNTSVINLSSLFLQEFYKKLKYTLTPGLEGLDFVDDLNVGNFIRQSRNLYESKGTPESFRILFNVLFGETPTVVDLERFLIKPSDSSYIRRDVALIDVISGDPTQLFGQTIKRVSDPSTSASVSEVENITREGKLYYKLSFFVGYDDTYPNVTGTFNVTPSTKSVESVGITTLPTSVITVDSTIGFSGVGTIYYQNNEIAYLDKSINQFLGCYLKNSNSNSITIPKTGIIRTNDVYYGYENGNLDKKVEFRIVGILSKLNVNLDTHNFLENENLYPKNLGEIIGNGNTRKEIFANSLDYNTSSRYQIDSYNGNTIILNSSADRTSLKVGDVVEFLNRNTGLVVSGYENVIINSVNDKTVILNTSTVSLNNLLKYDIRRIIKKASSTLVPIEYGNSKLLSDVQNLYDEDSKYLYIASNSLPSYPITINTFTYNVSGITTTSGYDSVNDRYSIIGFSTEVSFITGDRVYYKASNNVIDGLQNNGNYYIEILGDKKQAKLYSSASLIGTDDYVQFGKYPGTIPSGTHNFILYSQKSNLISAQKIFKKFTLDPQVGSNQKITTIPGSLGILKNGVEIYNYKSNNKIYYGHLENVKVLNGGYDYDVINPPYLKLSTGSALAQPVVTGSFQKVYVDPQDFDIDAVVSIAVTGGNGNGASFEPVIETYRREIDFDARPIGFGGGLDYINERISFVSSHNLINGQAIIYDNNNCSEIGIGTYKGSNLDQSKTLKNGAIYYAKVINDKTIEIYNTFLDYSSGINTVGFTTIGNSGVQKFKTEIKNTLTGIKIINGGNGYSNRKLRVKQSGISTSNFTINYNDHGFSDGDIVNYSYETSSIAGLSTSNQYYILKIDSNSFRLCDAGIGATSIENYERKNYVKFSGIGSGYQIFSYPDIKISVNYSSIGIGSTEIKKAINATPIVRGNISQVYLYEKGSNYGSNIVNVQKRPSIEIKTGESAQFSPIISNGKIIDVRVQYGGADYYSTPDLIVKGSGTGAILRPIIENNKITDVIIVNSGIGYTVTDTSIYAQPSGKNAVFEVNVRSLTINNSQKYGIQGKFYRNPSAEVLIESGNNLQYAYFGYSQLIKDNLKDIGTTNGNHSPIIGWAYDGNPIYGPYGYSDPNNISSKTKKLESGYTLTDIENRPSTTEFPYGFFVEDYQYTNSGDLDFYNGRFGKTPEFPNGVYAYFTTVETNNDGQLIGKFPYFIGNEYRSPLLDENINLNQSFDFDNSKLIRNTTPYKVNSSYASNDFIPDYDNIRNQKTIVESVSSGSVDGINILTSGENYKVGDSLNFDNSNTEGGGVFAKVSYITGKEIVDIKTDTLTYTNSLVVWNGGESAKVYVKPYHELLNGDNIIISGLSTQVSNLNGYYQIGITTHSSILSKDIPSYASTGIVTDIYLTNVPSDVSIGSSIKIENEVFSILNKFENFGIVRVLRSGNGVAHTESTPVYFIPDSFAINKNIDYFDSLDNSKVYFNPTNSIGVGTTSGSGISKNYSIGITTFTAFIPTQSIFVPNHPFKTNQQVTFRKPSGASAISVANTSGSTSFNILSGSTQTLYVINKSKDYIGIVTNVGLTTTTNGLFFLSSGSNNDQYSIESNFSQINAKVDRVNCVVSVSTAHSLKVNDEVILNVKPNLTVGTGTSTSVYVKLDSNSKKLLINPLYFTSSGINTTNNSITILSHKLNTGDKISYQSNGLIPEGLKETNYFVYKVNDDTIKLCESYLDSINNPPNTVDITGTGSSTQSISLINPQISAVKNNNLIFNLSDSSLSGYKFKIYYDNNFSKEFISIGSTNSFSVTGVGTIGVSTNASLILNYFDNVPEKLYYNLEKSGFISTADFEVVDGSEIIFTDSSYNGKYNISGIGITTFNLSLKTIPEKSSYNQSDCDLLEYITSSNSEFGGISKVKLLSGGNGYKSLPIFTSLNSKNGKGGLIVPISKSIGKIKESRIVNEEFEYSSDKTIRPAASIPKIVLTTSSNKIDKIEVLNGGENYVTEPDLICVDSNTGEKINSGLLKAKLFGSTISSVIIEETPKGLPDNPVTIRAINNSNSISVDKVQTSNSGIVTCILTTPIAGFTTSPFLSGDKIFVEGIQKEGTSGDGFNSSDYGYQFFTIKNYFNLNPAKLEYDISKLTNNPGVAKTIQSSYALITNYKNYPEFKVTQSYSSFLIGEKIASKKGSNSFEERNLVITSSNQNSIRVLGDYELSKDERIRGVESNNEAVVYSAENVNGAYDINYFIRKNIGWEEDTGKLNENYQVTPDNDYYQNLSYTVKSTKTWDEIVTPVNNVLHTSGLKNFADTQFINNVQSGIGSESNLNVVNDYISENRVDTINSFDLSRDVDLFANGSKFIEFKNVKVADYILCKTNRVLTIDNISQEFKRDNILDINSNDGFNRFLVQTKNQDNNEIQFDEIIVLNNSQDIYTLQKGRVLNKNNQIANIYGSIDENSNFYLKFEPTDPYNSNYDIKVFQNTFITKTGIASTQSVGFVDLIGSNKIVNSGISTTIFSLDANKYNSVYANVHILNSDSTNMNYVELYLTHDGVNTYISEYYFDDNQGFDSYGFIGSFSPSISGGILKLDYINTSNETIIVRTKNVGFGSTSIGIGTYRFKSAGQNDGDERTVILNSNYTSVSTGSTTLLSLDKSLFSAVKSVVKIGYGKTTALHQIINLFDGTDCYSIQHPFISIGSTSGIGTFDSQISGSNFVLKFYPDQSINSKIEILSYNEIVYKDIDIVNKPLDLIYSPVKESLNVKQYYGFNSLNTSQIESNILSFEAYYEGYPIFVKTFNPTDTTVLNLSTGKFTIINHFFSTGEELTYTPNSTFADIGASPLGIGSTLNYSGIVTTILPTKLYAIKDSNTTFRVATRPEYALQGIGVTFTSYGSGNAHTLEMYKKNEKSLITIDNIVQYPISYTSLNYTLSNNSGQVSSSSSIFCLSGITSIRPKDLLKIDNEFTQVENVGFGTSSKGPISYAGTFPLVEVTRNILGSTAGIHTDTSKATIYRGSYSIIGNKIFFTESPNVGIAGYNQSNLLVEGSSFNGRVFLRNDYTSNKVYDNISDQFTGIGQTFELKYQGISTVGLGTSGGNGVLFINSIFQSPTTLNNSSNNYIISETGSSTNVTFTGITSSNGSIIKSDYDVNQNQLPRGGIIISLGSTPGLGYAPLVGASVTAVVSGGSIISVGLGTRDIIGSGYRGPVSVAVTESGHTGTAATISATVGAGGTLSFSVIGGGSGYTSPTINVSSPSYQNLPITGVSRLGVGNTTDTGVGLLLNIEVGASSTTGIGSTLFGVQSFNISRSGYGFKKGDVFKAVGLVTAKGLSNPISEFQLTVIDTFNDSFAAWQLGEMDYIDSVKDYQDGTRTRFPLYYNSQLLSFEINNEDPDSQLIDLNSLLVIFINGVLQEPKSAYQFNGGTSFTFTDPPKPEDNISIFFYRGTRDQDSLLVDVLETLKVGDEVQLLSNNSYNNQDNRTVYAIASSNKIETNLYTGVGIDSNTYRPLNYTKQKVDLTIGGEFISKSRDSLEPQIYPTANIIKDFNSTSTEMFVDNADLFVYEGQSPINFDAIVVSSASTGKYEVIKNISSVQGFEASVVGIATTTGIGTPLALKFTISKTPFTFPNLSVGYPIYISNTSVGSGLTSINLNNNDVVSISTSFVNNIYYVHAFNSTLGIITCNVHTNTSVVGIATTGTLDYPVGNLSWGRLAGFTRSSSPISIALTGYTSSIGITTLGYGAGLSTYPIVQRRKYGLRKTGSLKKNI